MAKQPSQQPATPGAMARDWFDRNAHGFDVLASRWEDEYAYESINEYREQLAKTLPPGFTVERVDGFDAHSKPRLRMVFVDPLGTRYGVKAGRNAVEFGRLK